MLARGGSNLGTFQAQLSSSVFGDVDCPIRVVEPKFFANPENFDLSVGSTGNADIVLSVDDNGAREQYASVPIIFSIQSSNPNVVAVPSTRTLAVDEAQVSFTLQALAAGAATITLTAPGLGSYSFDVTVSP